MATQKAGVASVLILFDIDGTLLQRASTEHALALHRALREVHGEHLEVEAAQVRSAGRTDGAIARDILRACGVEEAAIDDEVEAVARACCAAYRELCPPSLEDRLAPGIADVLHDLGGAFRFSLVTGNFEPVARLKLERAGIGAHFPEGQGAFGTDAEAREELPPLARARAGGWPRERTVVVGDTPSDISCARADGLRVVAVATGSYPAAALHGADAVVEGAADFRLALDALVGR